MKTFLRFTLAVSLAIASYQLALSCFDYEDPTFDNHFKCVKELPSKDSQDLEESARFWASYAGLPYSDEIREAVDYMPEWQFEDEEPSNLLIATLRKQGKLEGLEFLRLNAELLSLQTAMSNWDYRKVTPADYEQLLRRIDALKVTGELNRRKTFLKMRCLFSLKDYNACLRLWDTFASKWEPSPLRSRVEGYVAGVYCRRKDYDKALPMFFELGDDGSIQYCVNRMLANTSIEQQYLKDPNAPILGYILEDYANYYYHAVSNEGWERGSENPIWTVVTDDAQKNIQLAERVVSEGKATDLQMWQAFAGYLQMMSGQANQAYQSFSKAEKLRGDDIIRQNIRAYKFAAALRMEPKIDGFEDYLLNELTYWKENDSDNSLHNIEMFPHLLEYVKTKGDDRLTYIAETAFSPEYDVLTRMDHAMNLDQVLAIKDYLHAAPASKFEALFIKYSSLNGNDARLDELIGTKYMRLGQFDKAAEYLARVPQDYIRYQGISNYLRMRTMPEYGFERSQRNEPDWEPELCNDNYKLEFCQRVLELQNTVAHTKGEARAKANLELAKWLFQASAAGDLWGMSEYSWSTWGPFRNELNDLSIACLLDAIQTTKDYSTLVECHFGLAANWAGEQSVLLWDEDKMTHVIQAEGTQLQGYKWLKQQTNRSHEVFEHCDWLKLYVMD